MFSITPRPTNRSTYNFLGLFLVCDRRAFRLDEFHRFSWLKIRGSVQTFMWLPLGSVEWKSYFFVFNSNESTLNQYFLTKNMFTSELLKQWNSKKRIKRPISRFVFTCPQLLHSWLQMRRGTQNETQQRLFSLSVVKLTFSIQRFFFLLSLEA